MPDAPALYFAYGSNMHAPRLRARVGAAEALGPACLHGHQFLCNKIGSDGSAKANVAPRADAEVWGVVWRLRAGALETLDEIEGGYERVAVTVSGASVDRLTVATYRSTRTGTDLVLFGWYKALMVAGARAHGLPRAWVQRLEALTERPDPGR